jgi:hypothetical protein
MFRTDASSLRIRNDTTVLVIVMSSRASFSQGHADLWCSDQSIAYLIRSGRDAPQSCSRLQTQQRTMQCARFLSGSERRRIACTFVAAELLILAASVVSTWSEFKSRNCNRMGSSNSESTASMPQEARPSLSRGAASGSP